MNAQEEIEGELIFGALRRERQWKIVAAAMGLVAVAGVGCAAAVTLAYTPPPPVLVPYDPATGVAIPNAAVEGVTLDQERAVIEAAVYRYVIDRETYNQVDNDQRIGRALSQSKGRALASLRSTWDSAGASFPPARYGDRAVIDVNVTGITRITNDRAQIRLVKQLQNEDGVQRGAFTVVLKYEFNPSTVEKSLEAVWRNPFGFAVTEYSITSDKFEGSF